MFVEEQTALRALSGRPCWVVGCGFLGSCLLAACRAAGMLVLGIDRELPADIQGNAADPALLAKARAALEPEFIFCCLATHGGGEAAYRAAYGEVPRALQAACPSARLLFCSSSSVYGGQGGAVVDEASASACSSARARVLLAAEEAVLRAGGCVARLVPLYGGHRCELVRRFVQREPELPGEDARSLNYVHRADAANALLCLAAASLTGDCPPVVNVCGESFGRAEVYEALAALTGLPRVEVVAEEGRRGLSDQRVSAALLRSLGWSPQVRFLNWASTHWRYWKLSSHA